MVVIAGRARSAIVGIRNESGAQRVVLGRTKAIADIEAGFADLANVLVD